MSNFVATIPMDVGFDMDGVVVNLLQPVLDIYNAKYGRAVKLPDITRWDMAECVPDGTLIYEIFEQPGLFENLPIHPGADWALRAVLAMGHRPYLVTAGSNNAPSEKSRWVQKHLPYMRDRLFQTNAKTPKGLIPFDVLVDDGPHNLLEYKARHPNGFAIAVDYAYTEPARPVCDRIVDFSDPEVGWASIVSIIQSISK